MVKKTLEDGTEEEEEAAEFEKVFEDAKSYIHLKLSLSQPVVPKVPEKPEPTPGEIVAQKQFITWPYSKEPTDDFCKQVTLATESLAKEMFTMFDAEYTELEKRDLSSDKQAAIFEEHKKEFFYEINTQGKYHILKEKMKKSIVRIVREHFKRTDASIRGLTRDTRDHFYSDLYQFLVEKMRQSVRQLVQRKKHELHSNILVPKEQAALETEHLIEKTLGESMIARFKRLSSEQEDLYNNKANAEEYMIKLCEEMEGDQEALLETAKFYMRAGAAQQEKAEQYLRDAYSFGMKNQQVALMYACILIQNGRHQEAQIILTSLAAQRFEPCKVNLLLSISADQDGQQGLSQKYKAVGLVEYLRQKKTIPELGQGRKQQPGSHMPDHRKEKPEEEVKHTEQDQEEEKAPTNDVESQPAFQNVRLNQNEENLVYLELGEYLLQKSLCPLSKTALSYVTDQNSVRVLFCFAKAKMHLQEYQKAAEDLNHLFTSVDPHLSEAHVLYGHCQWLLGNPSAAKDAYIRAIRVANIQKQELKDTLLHQRLGSIFIQEGLWNDAKVIFEMCADKYETAFSFMNLGIACLHLDEFDNAEKVLMKANVLDIQNSNVWGYLTLVMLKSGERVNSAFQSLKESIRLGISNETLMLEIGEAFHQCGQPKKAKLAIEYAITTRAARQSRSNLKRIQEFLLQLSKVMTQMAKERDANNFAFAEQADI